ncbi:MAG: sugar phosphate isomerase/epimerase [Verrucomicrobia bacterium]|nr:sugar phosphate isomerase/epimerase [Verrucomicrobiota bacterium]
MKLSFSTLGCPDWSFDQILTNGRRYGFDGVAFRGIRRELDLAKVPEFSSGKIEDSRRRIEDAGLSTSMILTSASLMIADPGELEKSLQLAESHIDIASALGCQFVRVYGGRIDTGVSRAVAVQRAGDRLRRLGDYAGKRGVDVLIESHDDWVFTGLLRRAVQAAACRSTGILWDVHHPYRIAEESIAHTWDNICSWVRAVDIKDSITDFNARLGYRYVQIGEGDVPLRDALALLRSANYNGWLTFEWEKLWHPHLEDAEVAFPEFIRRIRGL